MPSRAHAKTNAGVVFRQMCQNVTDMHMPHAELRLLLCGVMAICRRTVNEDRIGSREEKKRTNAKTPPTPVVANSRGYASQRNPDW